MNEALIESDLRAAGAEVARGDDGLLFTFRGATGRFTVGPPRGDDDGWSLHCRVPIPAPAPVFELDLRPQTDRERHMVESGEAIDLEIGDDAFDRAFVVEAAPSDLIRAVLDAQVRVALTALAPCRLHREGSALHLATGPRGDGGWVPRMVDVCVTVAERLAWARDALERRDHDAALPARLDAYRDAAPLSRTDEDDRRAEREITALREVRGLRRQLEGFAFGVTLIAGLVAAAMVAMLWHC